MNAGEQRLSQLLKSSVPDPPHALSADQVTTRPADRSAKSWAIPALAAAAVAVIGLTAGVAASHHAGAPSPGAGAGRPTATASASGGCPEQTVPAFSGLTQTQAVAAAEALGYHVEVLAVASQAVPGTVVGQSPSVGSRVPRGAALTLQVSAAGEAGQGTASPRGRNSASPAPASCPTAAASATARPANGAVPAVTSLHAALAGTLLRRAGFAVTVVDSPPSAALRYFPPGVVYRQTPAAGTVARPGTRVTVYVAPKP